MLSKIGRKIADKIDRLMYKHFFKIVLGCAGVVTIVVILFWCLVGAALVKYVFS